MKKIYAIILTLALIIASKTVCVAGTNSSYMALSATGDWKIFTKNMEDKALLDAVGLSARQINESLENTGSQSLIINLKTNAKIYVQQKNSNLSHQLWNIEQTDDQYIRDNIASIVSDGFLISDLDYKKENVRINSFQYMKFITIPGSVHSSGTRGVVYGGTFVNGDAIVFVMNAEGEYPTEEEIASVEKIAADVSFTNIKEKTDMPADSDNQTSNGIMGYVLGGAGALLIGMFCIYIITNISRKDTDETEEDTEDAEENSKKSEEV